MKESEHLALLQNQVNQALRSSSNGSIRVVVSETTLNVRTVVNVPGIPKADFVLCDKEPVAYISHKDGDKLTDFIALGGVSHARHSDACSRFADVVARRWPLGHGKGTVGMELDAYNPNDLDLILSSSFGKNCGEASGPNSVDFIIQGEMKLISLRGKSRYRLEASAIYENVCDMADNHTFMLFAYPNQRADLGLINTKVVLGMVGCRKVDHWISRY